MDYRNIFKGKKITVMGLGLLGGALNDTIFLAECGTDLTVTDLKSSTELKPSLEKLGAYSNIKYTLDGHKIEDFQSADMILQPGNVPIDSIYLAEARKNNIPIFVSESLFVKYVNPEATLVGVTGTRGKSTVTQLIYEIIKASGRKVFLGGNVKNVSTLSLLDKVDAGDLVVMELDSWALHGMGDIKKSPYLAVFTTFFPDHLNYYKNDMDLYLEDKANIFKYQTEKNFIVLGSQCAELIKNKYKDIKSKIIITNSSDVPKDFKLQVLGEHNKYNVACAIHATRALDVSEETIKEVVENFKGVPGRLELIKEINGVRIYNDTTSTTPEATVAGLKALGENKNIVLIAGGAEKGLDMSGFVEAVEKNCKSVVLLSGSGTDKLVSDFLERSGKIKIAPVCQSLQEAVQKAFSLANAGDVVLLSPAFASFGMFKNEFDRGDQFNKLVSGL
ncbi:MAG: UDP-N-acetylmuramoyl-L-alanine--D-glutamate ligase [Parcubacteria group bacterium]|nr:UDP-N-acetylmuramoyl-L-alanine--D-glutamate ligase [Parcubacteria group bacterium]